MKKFLSLAFFVSIIVIISFFIMDKSDIISNKIQYYYKKYLLANISQYLVDNEYKQNINYEYLKINKNTTIKNKEDLKNAIYTYLDSGWDKYIVMCSPDYLKCTEDAKEIAEDKDYLTKISNFIHPFNSFEKFNTSISANGKLTFEKKNRYTKNQIEEINKIVNDIYEKNYDKSKNTSENIKIFHDYIINNAKYDSNNKTGEANIPSSSAYGVFKNNLGICSGYSDALSLFLNKLNVKNYRISSESHVWNLAYVDGNWKHIDATWDDPVNEDGKDTLNYDYFLLSTKQLEEKNIEDHNFDKTIYIEAK